MNIDTARFVISNTDIQKCPQDQIPEYAFIGRSNVGKSSLINMLANRKELAMTSSKPGKTLLINHFIINEEWFLVDLPGYGYARRQQKERENIQRIIEDYVLEREQLCCLFVLVDCRHEPQQIDVEFMEWLNEHDVPFAIIFTKGDKLKKGQLDKQINTYLNHLLKIWIELPPYFITSSQTKIGREEVLSYIEKVNGIYSKM